MILVVLANPKIFLASVQGNLVRRLDVLLNVPAFQHDWIAGHAVSGAKVAIGVATALPVGAEPAALLVVRYGVQSYLKRMRAFFAVEIVFVVAGTFDGVCGWVARNAKIVFPQFPLKERFVWYTGETFLKTEVTTNDAAERSCSKTVPAPNTCHNMVQFHRNRVTTRLTIKFELVSTAAGHLIRPTRIILRPYTNCSQ